MSELTILNKRLNEMSTEFQELNALKKELLAEDRKKRLSDSFSKYKFILVEGTVQPFDYLEFLNNKHSQVGFSEAGLAIASDGANMFSVEETEEAAELRLKVDKLISLAQELNSEFQPTDKNVQKKQYSTVEIYDKYVSRT